MNKSVPTRRPPRRSERSRLYRDRENRILGGVCAGLADYFGFNRVALRIILIVTAIPFTLSVILGYLALMILIPARPRDLYRSPEEEEFWKEVKQAPADRLGRVRHQMRGLENRLQRMEAWVTSRQYEIERELNR